MKAEGASSVTAAAEPSVLEPPQVQQDESLALNLPWQVVVLDDPVNTMDWVVLVFRRVFGYNRAKAHHHMLEVHTQGRSILWSGERETAEHYHAQLQRAHLTALLERASD